LGTFTPGKNISRSGQKWREIIAHIKTWGLAKQFVKNNISKKEQITNPQSKGEKADGQKMTLGTKGT
jgi:hypothetical protein